MVIYSDFKDYYDSARAFGNDESTIYRRKRTHTKISFNDWKYPEIIAQLKALSRISPTDYFKPCLLGFCGKLYYYWVSRNDVLDSSYDQGFTQEQVIQSMNPSKRRIYGYWWNEPDFKKLDTTPVIIGPKIFQDLQTPIFVVTLDNKEDWGYKSSTRHVILETNPLLKKYDFVTVFDPFSCFQEIEMFMGSVLATPDIAPLSVGGDAVIAAAKGFDEQSFRQAAPGQKKINRRLNRARKRGVNE